MNFLELNIDLVSVGLTVIAIGILGTIVFLNDRKSATNIVFFIFSILTIVYGVINYLSYQITEINLTLLILRLTIFSAVWHSFSMFLLFYVFPEKVVKINKKVIFLSFLATVVSILTLTPLVFSGLEPSSIPGEVAIVKQGPAIPVFGLTVIGLVAAGAVLLLRKFIKSTGVDRKRFKFILIGTVITFSLIISFNFILPVVFKIVRFVPLAPIFFFPFIIFAAYSIIKYRLFDVKVIATELLTFSLWIFLLIRMLLSNGLVDSTINIFVFGTTVVVGIFLIRSVMLEVSRREQLEKLSNLLGEATKKLEGANAQLQRLDQAKSDFISIASHQLRTPLTVIKGYISMMQEGSFGKVPPKINDNLTKVFLSNERLINLVEDLLNISRIESGRQQFDWTKFDIVELVGRLTDSLVQNAKVKGLKLSFIPPKESKIEVTAEYNKLHDVIINFIDNAIKYTAKGKIDVSVEAAPKGMVTIRVKDTGRGLDEVTKNSLFQKFARGQGSFQVNAGGTGLGLYVARMIVEAHEGKAWAESEGINKGSSFCFAIPIAGPKNKAALPFAQEGQKVENPVVSSPRIAPVTPTTPAAPATPVKK